MNAMFECNLPPDLAHDLRRTFYKVYLTARYEALFAQQKNCKHP